MLKSTLNDSLFCNCSYRSTGQLSALTPVTEFLLALELCDDAEIRQSETQPLVFVAGYVGQKVCNKLMCDLCKHEVISDKTM